MPYDLREIARARELIQDIQIFRTPDNKLACDVLLYRNGENKDTAPAAMEALGFAIKMADLNQNKTNPDYEASANHTFGAWRWMSDTVPGPDANVEFISKRADCPNREAAKEQGAELIKILAERTGLSTDELLSKVKVRDTSPPKTGPPNPLVKLPEPLSREELAPLLQEQRELAGAAR